jgi:Tfp pilus assembly PilM family ATPase
MQQTKMLYVVVTSMQTINRVKSWINQAGLVLHSVDIYHSALKKIAMKLENAEEGQALLHVEHNKSHLLIFKEQTVYMIRDLEFNAENNTQNLSAEIQRSFDYCASKLHDIAISRLLVTPLNGERGSLLSDLSNALGLPVREIEYDEFITCAEMIAVQHAFKNPLAIGAVIH